MKMKILFSFWVLFSLPSWSEEKGVYYPLDQLMEKVESQNPQIRSQSSEVDAQDSLRYSAATLDDPMLGLSELNRTVKTQYATISQKLLFPVKYYYRAKVQGQKRETANFQKQHLTSKMLSDLKTLYYELFVAEKTIDLKKLNISTVREFARVAEKKYASGQELQHNSMKAHVELTQLEIDLVQLQVQRDRLQNQLTRLLGKPLTPPLSFYQKKLSRPSLQKNWRQTSQKEIIKSPLLQEASSQREASQLQKSLAAWNFAPDFQLTYQKQVSGLPEDSHIYSLSLTFPLWFWKKTAEYNAASSKSLRWEYLFRDRENQLNTELNSLKKEVESSEHILKIYETSLIPQAETAYKVAGASYRSGKGSFLDFLDSEKSFYQIRIRYYQSLKNYVQKVSQIESLLGTQIADWKRSSR